MTDFKYSVDLPYPKLEGPFYPGDVKCLMDDYSGRSGATTAVTLHNGGEQPTYFGRYERSRYHGNAPPRYARRSDSHDGRRPDNRRFHVFLVGRKRQLYQKSRSISSTRYNDGKTRYRKSFQSGGLRKKSHFERTYAQNRKRRGTSRYDFQRTA